MQISTETHQLLSSPAGVEKLHSDLLLTRAEADETINLLNTIEDIKQLRDQGYISDHRASVMIRQYNFL